MADEHNLPAYCASGVKPEEFGAVFRLRKGDGTIHGPMDLLKLQHLAATALVAPQDVVDEGDENWIAAPQVALLEMFWMIRAQDGSEYGPTTVGTVREFQSAGEVGLEDFVIDVRSGGESPVKDLIGTEESPEADSVFEAETRESVSAAVIPSDVTTGSEPVGNAEDYAHNLDVARDLRIRQLETDLKALQDKYDQLLQDHRRMTEEMLQLKGG